VQLRDEIRRIQIEVGTTTLFVTHDQEEALAMADRVGVMRDGRLEQLGPPAEIYLRPASPFVANFVGLSNRLPGRVIDGVVEVLGTRLPLLDPAPAQPVGPHPVTAMVRPESVDVVRASDGTGRVLSASFLGPTSRVTVAIGDLLVVAQVASDRLGELAAGTSVRIDLHQVPVALEPAVLDAAVSDPAAFDPVV
jgi:putative spermidine/putrescine transport system ATP-binding protein